MNPWSTDALDESGESYYTFSNSDTSLSDMPDSPELDSKSEIEDKSQIKGHSFKSLYTILEERRRFKEDVKDEGSDSQVSVKRKK